MFPFEFVLAHLVGDYLLQNDWMASKKKSSSLVCLIHVTLYLIPFSVMCLAASKLLPGYAFAWYQVALIGLQHFVQDRTSIVNWFMRTAGQRQFAQPPMSPWSIIVVDNTLHLLWIYLVLAIPRLW